MHPVGGPQQPSFPFLHKAHTRCLHWSQSTSPADGQLLECRDHVFCDCVSQLKHRPGTQQENSACLGTDHIHSLQQLGSLQHLRRNTEAIYVTEPDPVTPQRVAAQAVIQPMMASTPWETGWAGVTQLPGVTTLEWAHDNTWHGDIYTLDCKWSCSVYADGVCRHSGA